jgi:hypothetical protein
MKTIQDPKLRALLEKERKSVRRTKLPAKGRSSGLKYEASVSTDPSDFGYGRGPSPRENRKMSIRYFKIISAHGADLGTYQAASKKSALDKMAREAGYKSQADTLRNGIAPFAGEVLEVDRPNSRPLKRGFWEGD